jgi:hypothetical protein
VRYEKARIVLSAFFCALAYCRLIRARFCACSGAIWGSALVLALALAAVVAFLLYGLHSVRKQRSSAPAQSAPSRLYVFWLKASILSGAVSWLCLCHARCFILINSFAAQALLVNALLLAVTDCDTAYRKRRDVFLLTEHFVSRFAPVACSDHGSWLAAVHPKRFDAATADCGAAAFAGTRRDLRSRTGASRYRCFGVPRFYQLTSWLCLVLRLLQRQTPAVLEGDAAAREEAGAALHAQSADMRGTLSVAVPALLPSVDRTSALMLIARVCSLHRLSCSCSGRLLLSLRIRSGS